MRRIPPLLVLAFALASAPARSHVGSPNVIYDGDAGPYPVRVIIRPPAVIPGDAEITVRLREDRKVDRVSVQPVLFASGFQGAPPPDAARPVRGAPGLWSGQFLLMREGSWNVRVYIQGSAGEGMTQVPMPAIRSQIFGMDDRLGALLAGLGLLLFAGAVSIVGAAVREASLPPGQTAGRERLRRARAATVLTAVLLALSIWGGKSWWERSEADLRQKLFKPFGLRTTTQVEAGRPVLRLTIDDPRMDGATLIPDHGKLMHLFLLLEPDLNAFAHLHPVAQGPRDFLSALPALPAGRYRVYADIVDEDGFSQTLVDRVEIPAAATGDAGAGAAPALDPDDSWRLSEPLGRGPAAAGPQTSRLENGGTMVWRQEPLTVNRETTLQFEVRGPDGRPAALEPYMGMLGHAVITRDDGEVFIHLHPMGTVSMAAQQVFAQSESRADEPMDHANMAAMDHSSMAGMDHPSMPGMDHSHTSGALAFPYEFPQPGRYRLWLQVKSGGRILTGVFSTEVRGEE